MGKNFADALRVALEKADMTGYRLSQVTGLSRQLVSQLLRDEVQPGWQTVALISKALGVSCEAFITSDIVLPDVADAQPRGRPAADEKPAKRKK